ADDGLQEGQGVRALRGVREGLPQGAGRVPGPLPAGLPAAVLQGDLLPDDLLQRVPDRLLQEVELDEPDVQAPDVLQPARVVLLREQLRRLRRLRRWPLKSSAGRPRPAAAPEA